MITNFFIPELNNHDVQELWFQQDGTTCHTARATIDLLKDTFGDSLISRFGPVNWPPRSCDLTPLDYFLWGYVKSLVYADKPQTLDKAHLEDNIRRVFADIRPQMLEKVIENWTSRLDYIRTSRGSHMPEIIFKIRRAASPLMRFVERKRGGRPLTIPRVFSFKIGVEPSQNVLSPNPTVYFQVDDHGDPRNCPAAVSSEKNKRPSSYGVLPSPGELGYGINRCRIFLQFLMNGAVI
ncbi:uncharacterized protein TNCV_536741 [Trichonephila clavipes]|nr:uncharacterized protein TNCV_536741 [Trichonephila clavipes]